MSRPIPAVISVDVEPDGFQVIHERARATDGYEAWVPVMQDLRPALEQSTGKRPSFGWYFRMDQQIASTFGHADHLVSGFGNRVSDLIDAGDHVGLHTHPLRWSADRGMWVHDITDPGWIDELYGSSFDAFERCFGSACVRHRLGAALINQTVADALARAGTRVESALEPVTGWGVDGRDVSVAVDDAPMLVPNTDCAAAPRRPYRPSNNDFQRPGGRTSGMAFLPITTSWLSPHRPAWQTVLGATLKRRMLPRTRALYPASAQDPRRFWDLVSRQLRLMLHPFINIGIRTDVPGSSQFANASRVLRALPEHPLGQRIVVVDPLTALSDLLPGAPPLVGSGR